jgi:phosphate:Na+ symporter
MFFKVAIFSFLAYVLISFDNIQTIVAGVAIFIVGMIFMEDGFKSFTGGTLQEILKSWTNKTPKAIFTGFLTTAIVQSSSLVSLITISFLSAELIALSQGVGIIFGANIGTTATSWIVSTLGVKIKIAHYAMFIIIFGVLFKFMSSKTLKGVGDVFLGLGFIFLGIDFMKEGFETLKEGIDLAKYHIDGFLGIITYIFIGAIATIVVQSSSATMAIVIVALSSGQIVYVDAIALAIGSNIGTTVTAVIGALTSNSNGKRLAVAHFIFNSVTGGIAIIFVYQLIDLIDVLAPIVGIGAEDWAMKLTLFHTIFNVIGVLVLSPFIPPLVKFLEGLFKETRLKSGEPKFLDKGSIEVPLSALSAVVKESEHLYHNSMEIIVHGLSLHRKDVFSEKDIEKILKESYKAVDIDIDRMYLVTVKNLYGDIIKFSTLAQDHMGVKDSKYIYSLKIVNRGMVRAIKDIEKVQENINVFISHKNIAIRDEYNFLRGKLIKILRELHKVENIKDNFTEAILSIEVLKEEMKDIDIVENGRIDKLIRENLIDTKMATSLINDSIYIYNVANRLIEFAETVWADNEILREYDSEEKRD